MSLSIDAPIFLLGMPRSGTTWLSQIFESVPDCIVRLSPPYSNDFRDKLNQNSSPDEWKAVILGAAESTDEFLTQNWRRRTGELVVFDQKSRKPRWIAIKDTRFHRLYAAGMSALPKAKTIYIVRHPAAALWSWRNCKEFPASADFASEWYAGECRKREGAGEFWGFADWKALTSKYLDAAENEPDRFKVVRYEDLVDEALKTTSALMSFCGLPFADATRTFLNDSQTQSDPRPYSVFKSPSRRNAWQDSFPKPILEQIEAELAGTRLEVFLK